MIFAMSACDLPVANSVVPYIVYGAHRPFGDLLLEAGSNFDLLLKSNSEHSTCRFWIVRA
jgi:hypothetical protein